MGGGWTAPDGGLGGCDCPASPVGPSDTEGGTAGSDSGRRRSGRVLGASNSACQPAASDATGTGGSRSSSCDAVPDSTSPWPRAAGATPSCPSPGGLASDGASCRRSARGPGGTRPASRTPSSCSTSCCQSRTDTDPLTSRYPARRMHLNPDECSQPLASADTEQTASGRPVASPSGTGCRTHFPRPVPASTPAHESAIDKPGLISVQTPQSIGIMPAYPYNCRQPRPLTDSPGPGHELGLAEFTAPVTSAITLAWRRDATADDVTGQHLRGDESSSK